MGFFLGALTFHFYQYDYLRATRVMSASGAILLALMAGLALSQLLRQIPLGRVRSFLLGMGISVFLLVTLLWTEHSISQAQFLRNHSPSQFSQLHGHAGTHAGRALISIYDRNFSVKLKGALREHELAANFRIRHFEYLEQQGKLDCDEKEDSIECSLKWMGAFAEAGYWDSAVREFFYRRMRPIWEREKKNDSFVAYLIKDQELEASKMNLVRQLGFEDELSDPLLLIQEEEELKNIKLSQKFFSESKVMMSDKVAPLTPNVLKLRDLYAELETKSLKLNDLEIEVAQMRQKLKTAY